ncbi:glutathione peroxidase [Streptomyces massasporeus]
MSLYDIPLKTLTGEPVTLADYRDRAVLVVNVASKCGLTPQYEGLEKLQKEYGDRGFTVLGVPCNQFAGQEPGSAEEIQTFCSTTYGVSFPLLEKIDVNGEARHPLYTELVKVADAEGEAGCTEPAAAAAANSSRAAPPTAAIATHGVFQRRCTVPSADGRVRRSPGTRGSAAWPGARCGCARR